MGHLLHRANHSQEKLYAVTEYAAGGTLSQWIHTRGDTGLSRQATVWRFLIQLSLALHSIHARNVLHRDFKSQNIFLDSTGAIKVGDFGVSKILQNKDELATTVVGTPLYLSPELYSGQPYNSKSDMWALGVVLYECCTGKHPFMASNHAALAATVLQGDRTPISPGAYRCAVAELHCTSTLIGATASAAGTICL